MQLLKVYSNKESFKTITFHKNSLNIVFGGKKDPQDKSTSRTFNGVGKSLLLSIIDFCLGANNGSFKNSLSDWIFYLDFEHADKNYTVRRPAVETDKIYLNEEELSLDLFNKRMEEMLFSVNLNDYPFISYRTLINRFLRAKKQSYVNWDTVFLRETPFQKLINNFYLLGFNIDYLVKKKILKDESDKIKVILDALDKDDEVRNILLKYSDVDIAMGEIKVKIKALEIALKKYEVAENNKQIQIEADHVSSERKEIANNLLILEKRLENINKSIESAVPLDLEKNQVILAYQKISIDFPELLKNNLKEVLSFHNQITIKRVAQLNKQKLQIIPRISKLKDDLSLKGQQLDSYVKLLGGAGALDDYSVLVQNKAQAYEELDSLQRYKNLIEHNKKRKSEIKLEKAEAEKAALEYKIELDILKEKNNAFFKKLSETFYPFYSAGITVKENTRDNQTQYDLGVNIKYDGSDGIAGVKMLCFDLTILVMGNHHGIKFLAHDSRILSDTDARQVAVFLRLVLNICKENKLQYILTINQDFLDQIKNQEYLSVDEIEEIKSKEVIMLKDGSPEEKLLGIDVEIEYDK